MKNRFAGITAAVMAAAMMMTFPVQAFAGTYGSAKNVGYVQPCSAFGPADPYVTASSPAAYTPAAPSAFAPAAPAAQSAAPARQGQYEAVKMEISGTEEQTAALNRRMQTAQTQAELNQLAGQKYQVWDNELNSVWKRLEGTLSKDAMERLRAEEQTAALNRRMQAAQTQTELNELAGQKFQVWDNELNSVWKRLENTLSKDAMERLRTEERTWISQKEKAMQQEAAAYGSGSMASMAYAEKGTELTRARVYVLAEYLR